jgi:hypothetical protein
MSNAHGASTLLPVIFELADRRQQFFNITKEYGANTGQFSPKFPLRHQVYTSLYVIH